jgi:hypothetical protein
MLKKKHNTPIIIAEGDKIMKWINFFIFSIGSAFFYCESDKVIDTSSNTATDPIADITYMKGHFYTTNFDNSMKSGSQIFLYHISNDGLIIENKIDLIMNGQGYLAIANDGTDLYLQSRQYNSIIKCSTVGEVYYNDWFVGDGQKQGCGICYAEEYDSLCVLSRNLNKVMIYELLFVDKNNPNNWHIKASAELPDLNMSTGAFAIDIKENELYILGQDTTNTDILLRTDLSLKVQYFKSLATDSTTGLCFKESDLHFGYLNKKIKKIEF